MNFHKTTKNPIIFDETCEKSSRSQEGCENIRHTTTLNDENLFKFSEVWKRAFLKIRVKLFLSKITKGALSQEERIKRLALKSEEKFLKNKKFLVIHPEGKFSVFWRVVMVFIFLDTGVVMPFTTSFLESSGIGPLEIKEIIVDLIFFIDFGINCLTGYYELDVFITSHVKIFLKYLKSGLLLDLLCSIPFSLILLLIEDPHSSSKLIHYIRLSRLYSILRFSRILKLIKLFRKVNLVQKLEDFLSIRRSMTALLSSLLTILLAIHIMACLWYFSCKIDDFSPDTWVVRNNLQDNDTFFLYLTSIYWVICTLSTVGYGDISAYTIIEKLLSIFWMVLSLYFYCFTIGSLSALLSRSKSKSQNFSIKISKVEEISAKLGLSKEMISKIKRTLKSSTKFSGFTWKDKESLLEELPKKLRLKLAAAMHGGAGKKLEFFKNREGLMAKLMPLLVPYTLNSGESIYEPGDRSDEIYFVVKGTVFYEYQGKSVFRVRIFEYFGDIEVIFKVNRKYLARSSRYLEILALDKKILRKLKDEDYFVWDEIRNRAVEREENIMRKFIGIQNILEFKGVKKVLLKDVFRKTERLREIAEKFHENLEKMKMTIRYEDGRVRSNSY
jgi:CRP-like cAMP-binding protein